MKTCPKCGGRVTTFSPDLDWCASCEARYQPGEIPDVDPKANEIEQLQAENTRLQSKLTHACEEGKKLQAENVRLREAVAAVVEAWEEGCWQITGWNHQQDINKMELRIDGLRQAAGIKAPPQDGDDDDEREEE